MLIHFVCVGNIFRSRLAEAYLNSKQIPEIKATSSGIKASENNHGPISWFTQRIIMNNKITLFETFSWQETTKELLDNADLVVFFEENIYKYAHEKLNFAGKEYFIWDIPDLDPQDTEIDKIKGSEIVFNLIKEKVDQFPLKLIL